MTSAAGWRPAWRVLLVTEGHGPAQRLAEVLRDADVGVRLTPTSRGFTLDDGVATVTTGCLTTGWTVRPAEARPSSPRPTWRAAAGVGTKDLRGRMPSRRGAGIDPLQLMPGDLGRPRAARRRAATWRW